MNAERARANRWKRPFGAGRETTAGRSRAARVNSFGALASAVRSDARFSVKARTPFVRSRSAGRAADRATAVLSGVWCQNARVPCVSRRARFVLPAPAGIATTTAAASAASPSAPQACLMVCPLRSDDRPRRLIADPQLGASRLSTRTEPQVKDGAARSELPMRPPHARGAVASVWRVSASAASAAEPRRRIRPRLVYGVAGTLLLIAVILSIADVGEKAGRLSDWQAFVLGVTQGLTELLPISSSGHLILVPWIADWHYLEAHPDFNKTFDVALHLGTLVAVVAYFWADVVRYVVAWFRSVVRRRATTLDERIAWWIFWATIPAAIAGALGEDTIENHLGQPWQIAIFLSVFGGLLWLADRLPQQKRLRGLRFLAAFLVGVSQILALMPGVPRSSITITSGTA